MKWMWPFRHLGLKLWSIAIAGMLWLVVAGEQTVERGIRVPLELQQFPVGLELGADAPSFIDVRVRGSSGTLGRVGPGDIVGVLDLRGARAGRRLFQMTPEQIRVPFGVQVVQVSPQSIALTFESTALRVVPIVPALEGTPAAGFSVAAVSTEPATVEVVGPESAIERVTEATTEPVSVSGASRDVVETVVVGFVDPTLRLRSATPAKVMIRVVPGPAERTLARRVIRVQATPSGLRAELTPPEVDVIVSGLRASIVDESTLVPWIDLSRLGPGEYTLTVNTDPAPEGTVIRLNPPTVQVRIRSVQ
jgi:hypothetical protein